MADRVALRVWGFRAGLLGLALLVVFVSLLPMQTQPSAWAPPDLVLAVCLAWLLRRPEYVPALLVGAVFLMMDLLLLRPPGLQAVLVVIMCEVLRNRFQDLREVPFPLEWVSVAMALTVLALAQRVVLAVLFLDLPVLGPMVIQLVLTILIYPLVVGISQIVFGIRRLAPGEYNAMGRG